VAATVAELRAELAPRRADGGRIGLVPTMGALHEGHLSLVRRAVAECDTAVASIFVNPLQFGPNEDFATYPRDFDRDLERMAAEGVEVVFAPTRDELIGPGHATTVRVGGPAEGLEGASRPGHFDGVATIVAALLGTCEPDRAYFGEKDYQQLAVIRRMVADLCLDVAVVGCPVVREPDGLAASSRNANLSAAERQTALALPRALAEAVSSWDGDATSAKASLSDKLAAEPGLRLDYAEVVDPVTLEALEGVVAGPARALVAGSVGGTRLIDNTRLEPPH
jgi:pantoate--beta-alanine ligase